ncbi:MAG: DNA-binding response regulator [Gammaproteobacteria bacterium HGW-Gammaproteobacteria-12]|nr:MAG: DNA-binding response regulator [Gammaproteobacteria bacterium HGW-Gammaproteobacteria-12]
MSRLLLIDDDQELCELLASWLTQEGFQVTACHEAGGARQALAAQAPDAVVLDVMLPDGSGLELLKQLRGEHGLELGADDYLAKPCDPRELTARLRAVLRRTAPAPASSQLELGDLNFSPNRGVVSIGEHDVPLTLSESRLLEALLRQPGEPVDKQALAQLALGRKLTLYDRSLDMHVSNLRKKLGPHPDGRPRILALRSRGYYYAL